ncbi:SPOR domain-containing protein [Flammeovirga pectinis]|uniref:SPOR domain-containing protein n=1 Tax=Flammeovirga pectinis TaxID=2494373 RepID=A0A3Q9FMZ6_9BACT|nr:SPOR domain-containing protein [Flammeovirga pectinis]AZQ61964.1 SPOR domain-containing protein [Flammeovirga pectinis]
MRISITKYFISSLYIFLFASCSVEQFDIEKPFSIKIASFREYDNLENAFERVSDMGLEPYTISQNSEEGGKWYHIMIGAERTLEDALSLKMTIEDNHRMSNLEIQNYNKLQKQLMEVEEDEIENYPVTWSALDLVSQLPYTSYYRLKSVKSLHYYQDINHRQSTVSRNISFDLPRGLSIRQFQKNVEEIVEGVYVDPLYGNTVTIHLIKLHEKHKLGDEVAKTIAERILNSKKYNVQKMEAFSSGNNWDMSGHIVTINPKALKSYAVQESGSGLILALVQSTENNVNVLKEMVKLVGEEQSIETYNSVHRLLAALPNNLKTTERLIAVDFSTKESLRGKSALIERGETELEILITDTNRGNLLYQLENFNDESSTDRVFKTRYSSYLNNASVEKVLLGARDAFIYKIRRRNPETRKMGEMPESIVFQNDREIGKISNIKQGIHTDEELVEKLSKFRLGEQYQISEPASAL